MQWSRLKAKEEGGYHLSVENFLQGECSMQVMYYSVTYFINNFTSR